ncbi:hypothetical protein [Rhodococcus sp. NPDC058514]
MSPLGLLFGPGLEPPGLYFGPGLEPPAQLFGDLNRLGPSLFLGIAHL